MEGETSPGTSSTPQFHRALGLVDSSALVVGSMIGSGIFIVSAEVSRDLGCAGWLLLAWIAGGLLTVGAALCYSELSSMFPQAGGQYVFLREAYGPLPGFLYGWTLFMVIQSGTIAAVAVAFAKFLGVFVPYISMKTLFFDIPIASYHWKFSSAQLVGLLVIAVLTSINCMGIHAAKLIQTTFTVTKASALAILIVLGLACTKFAGWEPNAATFWQPQDTDGHALSGLPLLAMFSLAMVGPLFASDAWNNITFAGEEVKDASKTLPRSLLIGTMLVTLLYVTTNIVYILLLPVHGDPQGATVFSRGIQYAAEQRVGTAAAEIIFGPVGEQIMAAAIMVSTFGALNGCILSGPRAYYAMAKDGLFFKGAGLLNAHTHVPVFGLILQGIWACILTTTGTYSDLLEYVVFSALLFYVLTVAGLLILRKKRPDADRPYKVVLYPILPVAYLIFATLIMIGQICMHPGYSGAGLLIILSGIPAFLIWRKKSS